MENIVNRIKKDTVIIACKKRAKEILKKNPDLTLMKCMDLSAQELKFNHWYDLHNSVKSKILEKNPQNFIKLWEEQINHYFNKDYETIHFEVRGYQIKLKGRKFGLLDELDCQLDITVMNKVLKELKISPSEYGWLEREKYNIQTMPVAFDLFRRNKEMAVNELTMNDYYDMVIVKKENKISKLVENEEDFNEKLKSLGFSLSNIADINHEFSDKNYIIASGTGHGKSKSAETIVQELVNKNKKVYFIDEFSSKGLPTEEDLKKCIKGDFDYIYIPEIRINCGNFINSLLMFGVKVIATIHAVNIDVIKNRLEEMGVNSSLLEESTLLMYQKRESLLCNDCKEMNNDFGKVIKEEMFLDYLRKYKKTYEGKLFKKSNKMSCSNKNCHHGFSGRILIAETFNLGKALNDDYGNNQVRLRSLKAFKENKIGELLRLKSADYHSNRFKKVLEGITEL